MFAFTSSISFSYLPIFASSGGGFGIEVVGPVVPRGSSSFSGCPIAAAASDKEITIPKSKNFISFFFFFWRALKREIQNKQNPARQQTKDLDYVSICRSSDCPILRAFVASAHENHPGRKKAGQFGFYSSRAGLHRAPISPAYPRSPSGSGEAALKYFGTLVSAVAAALKAGRDCLGWIERSALDVGYRSTLLVDAALDYWNAPRANGAFPWADVDLTNEGATRAAVRF